jgi:small-conductance mechanosensitive channel
MTPILRRLLPLFTTTALLIPLCVAQGQSPSAPADPVAPIERRAVMTAAQVVEILDETVAWYRTLGVQQQSANQPSDLLILYANRQTADKVVQLAFEIARANAELLSSEADLKEKAASESTLSSRAQRQVQQSLDARRAAIEAEARALQGEIAAARKEQRPALQSKLGELQSELDLVNARRNLVGTMTQFAYQSDANGSGANALKEHIDAVAAAIPASGGATATATVTAATPSTGRNNSGGLLDPVEDGGRRLGIWDLTNNVLRLSAKMSTIDAIDQRTAALQDTFARIRTSPQQQIQALSTRGDALARAADGASSTTLKGVRDQFDTIAWLFRQTAAILVPLSQEGVLLEQYRHNLESWRDSTRHQYVDALKDLAVRVAVLVALLAVVFAGASLWRRAVFRYVQEPRRRYQLLLVRAIVLWSLVVAIIGFTFATEMSSVVTFAGLLTAGLAVAMQSVLVSIVGYFFLIGKYGIRVGDRVQIGAVNGEVIDLGLVRLHLMELAGQGPTGRVVAFANSVVFQSSGGIFKQIPGVNLAWHEMTLTLPQAGDYSAIKEKLLAAANAVIHDYRDEILRQTREIHKNSASPASADAQAQVQLRFSESSVEAVVRYPVQLQRAAEIDERVSRELLNVIRSVESPARLQPPGSADTAKP